MRLVRIPGVREYPHPWEAAEHGAFDAFQVSLLFCLPIDDLHIFRPGRDDVHMGMENTGIYLILEIFERGDLVTRADVPHERHAIAMTSAVV